MVRPSPFFSSFTVECVSWYWVGRSDWKKKKKLKKKSQEVDSRPWYPRTTLKVNIHIFGLTKCTIYCEKCSCFCSCFSLCCYYAHFSDLRIISSEKWFIYVVTFYFFLENAKNLVGRTTVNGEKKEDGVSVQRWRFPEQQLSANFRARDWGENPGPRSARLKLNSRNSPLTRTRFCTISYSYSAKTANIICLCGFKVTERNGASLRKDVKNKKLDWNDAPTL